jgi:predicted transcriptional regulator
MEKQELLHKLRVHIVDKYKTQKKAADHWGFSSTYISRILNGHNEPTEAMLSEMGLKRVQSARSYAKVRK